MVAPVTRGARGRPSAVSVTALSRRDRPVPALQLQLLLFVCVGPVFLAVPRPQDARQARRRVDAKVRVALSERGAEQRPTHGHSAARQLQWSAAASTLIQFFNICALPDTDATGRCALQLPSPRCRRALLDGAAAVRPHLSVCAGVVNALFQIHSAAAHLENIQPFWRRCNGARPGLACGSASQASRRREPEPRRFHAARQIKASADDKNQNDATMVCDRDWISTAEQHW